mmetsp:Transcript_55527/g.89788  ORF Transcript_55527/g.89788 Transcript_55527/m.89788 type:complete len:225 (-) Transcript_55527:37-711(-)
MSEELFLPGLRQIPFFEKYNFEDDTTVCAIVHRAMIEVSLLTGDELFSSGQPAHKLYLLTSGVMDYWHCRDKTLHRSLHSDQWACEPALWLEWIHCGDMRAHTCCEVVGLDARTFRDLVFSTSRCRSFLRTYSLEFREYLKDSGHWATDVWLDKRELWQRVEKAWEASEDFVPVNGTDSGMTPSSRRSGEGTAKSAARARGLGDWLLRPLRRARRRLLGPAGDS